MKNSLLKYWICQLGGWGGYYTIAVFAYKYLSIRTIDHFYEIISLSVILGLICTHIMRMIIKEYQFLDKPIRTQIFSLILITIVFAILYACADAGTEKIFDLKDKALAKISLKNEI